jgi:hypothetical protein
VDAIGLRIDCVLDMKTSARCERGHHAVALAHPAMQRPSI